LRWGSGLEPSVRRVLAFEAQWAVRHFVHFLRLALGAVQCGLFLPRLLRPMPALGPGSLGQAGCRSQALRPHRRARKVDYGGARSLAPTQPGAHTPYHPRCSRLKVTGVLALQDYSRITSSSSWEQSQAFFRTPSLLRCLRVSSYALSCGSFTGSVASNTMWI